MVRLIVALRLPVLASVMFSLSSLYLHAHLQLEEQEHSQEHPQEQAAHYVTIDVIYKCNKLEFCNRNINSIRLVPVLH